ncbi:molecular chaperone DjiA [Rhodobacter capsulatus]|jgi:DnaJ like chaperone protein|uniref:Heat shock protein DnaJ domain protein n=1 Tax=Rhodobacter capsulatus (strain ATCC BAA-309 / NBRC 16581 / SB1003) TaxID=272942 RepID=D5APJ9_RHOCB|nr:molecular chaperone DjiA [Rhodobacter capsulatus]ADE84571.1 heat shock protein DnaJ domain protein [Rhodobacter capsulatus SB 1003]ETD02541.1 dimethylmenaquinone methyltransferase [Rhodobacter capsulatus DE442]ETD78639.1 dimethylmenaquinone methyltransferase [Rhodobacter capsulatus R121]ETE54605.1 dimethylmenaquinone methyltransferase [Rhodobacter capsulatus Y262]MDS0926317.1 molecular chaperone DjiA [Rhodobacter capsulatus]
MDKPLSLWARIGEALSALARGEGLSAVFDHLKTPPERSVAFTIAVIALGAKMAKADGRVTRDEVTAFRRVFVIPSGEEQNAARVFDMARTDVAGFDAYARKIAAMFGPGAPVLQDLLEGLFTIALADGEYHDNEDAFLHEVAAIFGLDQACFRSIRATYVADAPPDPWSVLELAPGSDLAAARARWKAMVREAHPDRAMARGLPPEAVKLAEERVIALNRAWEEISAGAKQAAL